jgi:glycosyltransferase involved in cell wall biosynthesis
MNVLWIGKTGKANAWYHITLTASAETVQAVHVVRHEQPARRVESGKVTYHLFRQTRLIPDIVSMYLKGLQVIRHYDIDLIITYNVFPYGVMAHALATQTGKKLALCFIGADYHTWLRKQPARFLIQRALRRSDIVICKGQHMTRQVLKAGADERKLFYYPHFVAGEMLQQNGRHPKRYDIINISDFIPRKRIDVLVDALAVLNDKGIRLKACILGDGPLLDDIGQQIETAGLSGQIELAGYQTNILPWLQQSRIYVQTSRGEGLSLALLEALAQSLVPVVTVAGAERDLIRDNENGLFIKTGDPADLAAKLEQLTDPQVYDRMRAKVDSMRSSLYLSNAQQTMTDIINTTER